MPSDRESLQARGRTGGYTRAALAENPADITAAANQANAQYFVDQIKAIFPEITDPDEINLRASRLRQAHMAKLSQRAAEVRKARTKLRRAEAALDAARQATGDVA